MGPTTFIWKTLLSSTLVTCPTSHVAPNVYVFTSQAMQIGQWPEQHERHEMPHLPHEERTLRVDSSPSGTYPNSSAQVAFLRNYLGDKLNVITAEDVPNQSLLWKSLPNLKSTLRPQTKPLTNLSKRLIIRTRKGY